MKKTLRKAQAADVPAIMYIMECARNFMRRSGNPGQWKEGYPSEDIVEADVEQGVAFVIEQGGSIVAYFAILPSPEPTYGKINSGSWLDDETPYHVVHRIASLEGVHGIFRCIMDYCFSNYGNIRIDTHRDNSVMLHSLSSYGFSYCGIIHLADGAERLAFQKIL